MTWLTTWPHDGAPQYATHATERAAADHAAEVVRSKVAPHATYFWGGDDGSDPHRTRDTGPRTAERGEVAHGADRAPDRPADGVSEQEGGKGT